jgi:hypothetical protein
MREPGTGSLPGGSHTASQARGLTGNAAAKAAGLAPGYFRLLLWLAALPLLKAPGAFPVLAGMLPLGDGLTLLLLFASPLWLWELNENWPVADGWCGGPGGACMNDRRRWGQSCCSQQRGPEAPHPAQRTPSP